MKPLSLLTSLLVTVLSTAAGCAPSAPRTSMDPVGAAGGSLTLELRTSTPVIKVGESPAIAMVLKNTGTADLVLVRPGDGSECGWRTPLLEWLPAAAFERGGGRCGNINTLKASEVVVLRPGESVEWSEWISPPPLAQPGEQQISLRFSNVPDLEWQGIALGRHDEAAMARVKASSRVSVLSSPLAIRVREQE